MSLWNDQTTLGNETGTWKKEKQCVLGCICLISKKVHKITKFAEGFQEKTIVRIFQMKSKSIFSI